MSRPRSASGPSPLSAPPAASDAAPRWRRVLVFLAIAYALFALVAIPFWFLPGGITHPLYTWAISLAMFSPALATLVVVKVLDKGSWRDAVGLRFRGRWGLIGRWSVLAVLLVLALNTLSAVLMVLRGVPGDLSGRTWAMQSAQLLSEAGAPMPTGAAVALILAGTMVNLLVTVLPALGEEIGWRGWLWRELKPLGFTGAVTVGGVAWSLWHLPVVLIGHNYPGAPRHLAVAMFIIACVALNFLYGALTERAGGSPVPAAFGHTTLNSTLVLAISVVSTADTAGSMNWFVDTPLGAIGIVLVVLAGYLVMPRSARDSFGSR